MPTMIRLILFRCILAAVSVAGIFAGAALGDTFVSHAWLDRPLRNVEVSVRPGGWVAYRFHVPLPGRVTVSASILNNQYDDGSVFVCSADGFDDFQDGLSSDCRGVDRQRRQIAFDYEASHAGSHVIVADNRYSDWLQKHYKLSVVVPARMDLSLYAWLSEYLENVDGLVRTSFLAPRFDITVTPCGFSNAYSEVATGNVVLCTEWVETVQGPDMPGVVAGFLFHEIGHSLLNLWDIPGGRTEEMVDAFSTYMLLQIDSDGELVRQFVRYWEKQDSVAEAKRIATMGGVHPVSIQRAQVIRRNLNDARGFTRRWNRLLYPHLKTPVLCMRIADNKPHSDADLARSALRARNARC